MMAPRSCPPLVLAAWAAILCCSLETIPFSQQIRPVAALSVPTPRPLRKILLCDAPDDAVAGLDDLCAGRGACLHRVSSVTDEQLESELSSGAYDAFVVRSANTVSLSMISSVRASPGGSAVRVVGRAGTGCDNIDLAACAEAGLPVVTAAGANAAAVAEHALALVLACARRIKAASRSVEEGRWEKARLTGVGLRGKTAGIVGFGSIGAEVAELCAAIGMRVLVAPRSDASGAAAASGTFDADALRKKRMERCGAMEAESLEELLGRSDVVSVHLPLTDETRGRIGRAELAKMRPEAILVSTARGGVVEEEALLECLLEDGIAAVALDVFESEGPGLGEDETLMKLAALESTVITPHVGGHTAEAQADVWKCVVENVLTALEEL
mmetsp:Transcript_18548/g.53476  ORF Transcript_18548/g.53476 Transcript_18548/m.53476 type:complete len:385 (-) Transcript_18548:487-1641(-)